MERSIVPETDQPYRRQASNSTAASSATNSSLSLDLRIPMLSREAGRECTHFVMRQYVAEMREKDRNKCFPFAYSDAEVEQCLPSMEVPKYKYWCCQNCLNANGAVSSLEDIVEARDKEGDSSDTQCNRPFDPTLKNGINHGKAGHGVLSLLSPEENRIFHKNHKRKYNLFAGESSVSQKSITGPSFEESLKNVIDRFSLSNLEVSPLPSNKNIPMVKKLLRKDNNQTNGNVIAFPKGTETGILPQMQMESLNTISNLAPTNGTCHDWPENPRNNFNNIGQMKNQSFVFLFGKPLAACKQIEKADLVEKELFPKSSLKSRPGKSSSSLNSSQFPIKLFGRVLDKEKAKGSYVPVVSPNGVDSSAVFPLLGQTIFDPVEPLTLAPSYMKGRVGSMNDRTPVDMCTINMNPADFIHPHAHNPFMINGAKLKVGSRGRARGKSVREKGIGRTKQRVKKTT